MPDHKPSLENLEQAEHVKLNRKSFRFSRVLFRPKRWDWKLKAASVSSVLALVTFLVYFLSNQFATNFRIWDFSNVVVFEAILAWYLMDIFVSRRTIYSWLRDTEQPIKLEIRFFRRVLLLIVTLLCVVTFANQAGNIDRQTSSEALSGFLGGSRNFAIVLAGIFIATFGWMYTNFQKEVSDRITNTLTVVHQQLYGQSFVVLTQQLIELVKHARDSGLRDRNGILKVEAFDLTLASCHQGTELEQADKVSMQYLVTRLLNALEQIAYGVRAGYYDFHTLEMVFRQRFIRRIYLFSAFIRSSTDASYDDRSGQYRANNRTWEHCLWMIDQLPILDNDNIAPENRKYIVLPPKVS